jgi:hypothetical protein
LAWRLLGEHAPFLIAGINASPEFQRLLKDVGAKVIADPTASVGSPAAPHR